MKILFLLMPLLLAAPTAKNDWGALNGRSAKLEQGPGEHCAAGGVQVISKDGKVDVRVGPLLRFEFKAGEVLESRHQADGCTFSNRTEGTATRIERRSTVEGCRDKAGNTSSVRTLQREGGHLIYSEKRDGRPEIICRFKI